MNIHQYFDPKKTIELFGLQSYLFFFYELILREKFPKVMLLSGEKGLGKSTLTNHLMSLVFDNKNYDIKKNLVNKNSIYYSQYLDNIFPNIINFTASNSKNITIEDVRILKNTLSKTPISFGKRFIIIDDVETLNINCLNGLLSIIEKPKKNDNFILINNKSQPVLETIKSRAIEIKIIMNEDQIEKVSSFLLNKFNQKIIFDRNLIKCSPGNFLKYNYIFNQNKFNIDEKYTITLKKILALYKKEKDIFFRDILLFYSDYYLQKIRINKDLNYKKTITKRSLIFNNINDFFLYNLNQDTLIRSIENNVFYE